ncbi:putative protein, putative aminoglycoside N3'-acetyltransferase [Campylobacter iguaniorum]|uniref:AAC(3) family N-acetyltransferase n=1 Tax=Campylobacter iguaniorum TaxID=1244531 RepID=UPI00073A3D49|nr:AAC(3) family N-acetyltransferase [Campylobacter iguaniorum]ALV24006.1 putative protein, putative aminoglycoside N3'-acetyltransferase [Campylobacter iguaniorum]
MNLVDSFDLATGDFVVLTGNFNRYILEQIRKNKNYDLNTLINDIIQKIGTNGTLMFQTFSWDFCHNLGYDIKNTKSRTGALGNLALKRDDFKRTRHPIYSFAVWGKYQNDLVNLDNKSSFGVASPFEFMHKMNAKMIIVNLDLDNSFTFVHYAEEINKICYRYEKKFTGFYIDEFGQKSMRTYYMFVRNLEQNIITNLAPLHDLFIKFKVMSIKNSGKDEIKIIKLKNAYEIIEDDILSNKARSLHKTSI